MSARLRVFAAFVFAILVVAVGESGVAQEIATESQLTYAQMDVVNYAYGVFPQQLAAIERQAALADYEAAIWQARVKGFESTRSFGVYSATYHADQYAQLQLLDAQQRAACLRQQAMNLWRERQGTVAAILQNAAAGP